MQAVLNAALPVFALVLAGYVCGRRGILRRDAVSHLNDFVVRLALPALLFQAMAQIDRAQINHPGFIAAVGGGTVATFLLGFVLRPHPPRLADRSIVALAGAYPNTGFMGIPLCLAAFGPAGLPPAVIATLMTACVLFAFAIVLIETDLQEQRSAWRSAARVSRSLLRNPLVVAPVLGLAWAASGAPLPGPLRQFTTLLGAAASPCALVTIGLFLALPRPAEGGAGAARMVVLKLLLQPAVTGVLAFWVFPMPPLWSHSALLLSAMPIGTGPFMLAELYRREAAATSRAILISTVISLGTVSLLVAWFGSV